jgi:hypothetical protein
VTVRNRLRVDRAFVEADRTFSFQDAALVRRPGPLYAFPFTLTTKVSAPALGIGRRAIDALVDSTSKKPVRR